MFLLGQEDQVKLDVNTSHCNNFPLASYLPKLFLSCLFLIQIFVHQAFANDINYAPYPQPDVGYVTDHADILTTEDELNIERWLLEFEKQSDVEIIVVTINSLVGYKGTRNLSIETFATALFNTYGIGNMPNNDGVLLLISKDDREARIELGKHYGANRDDDASRIMQKIIIPQFKTGNYSEGIVDGTEAIVNEFAEMRVTFPWRLVGIALAVLS